MLNRLPAKHGLYDPLFEKDSCGTGFIVNVKGIASNDIVQQGLRIINNLAHRGGTGYDPELGDGSGMLLNIPHEFFVAEFAKQSITLPEAGEYAIGMFFLPTERAMADNCQDWVKSIAQSYDCKVLGWRDVPLHTEGVSQAALVCLPDIKQVVIAAGADFDRSELSLAERMYLCGRLIEKKAIERGLGGSFGLCSLSTKTLVYKGMLTAKQFAYFYPDLHAKNFKSPLSMVHMRYSTNTFPSWNMAQPFHMIAHNGEINAVNGNINWMRARQSGLSNPRWGNADIFPLLYPQDSDSSNFDRALEFLVNTGRSIDLGMIMMIPEHWEDDTHIPKPWINFYEYQATLMEPWDGPACVVFSDGRIIGGTLDRNGLRPARIVATSDDTVILASEVGVIDVEPDKVLFKKRLAPGEMFLVDIEQQKILENDAIKSAYADRHPYADWAKQRVINLSQLAAPGKVRQPIHETLRQRQHAFGYTKEDLKYVLNVMAQSGAEPIGSMGVDTPLAVLSERSRLLYDYFKQRFAQVTNPAIDSIREQSIMSLNNFIAPGYSLINRKLIQKDVLRIPNPVLAHYELETLRHLDHPSLRSAMLPTLFVAEQGGHGLEMALHNLNIQAEALVKDGTAILILSDRGHDYEYAPIPSLIAIASVHSHLVRKGLRMGVGLVIESGDAREVHHLALLLGYGATAVNPYLALETILGVGEGFRLSSEQDAPPSVTNYIKAANKGLLKIMAKMGISTLHSYNGAQIFECVGLSDEVINNYFAGTVSRLSGIGLDELAEEVLMRHRKAYPHDGSVPELLDNGGMYQFRRDGENHLIGVDTVRDLQSAVRENSPETYAKWSKRMNEFNIKNGALRGLLDFHRQPIPIAEVEPIENIMPRFTTGAMSLGSISREAHETLAIAMNIIGGRSNTGEGGEDPQRFTPDANGANRCSAIKQVASGRFGVISHYLVNAQELQIKIAQGAKPGEGGQLPGLKVDEYIGSIRHTVPGVGLISPPPHHDIYSIEDLKQLIFDLKNSNDRAKVSVKLTSVSGVGTIAAGVAKGKADSVLISGYDGGTGASPLSSIQHAGLPWELGLAETQQTLVKNRLREFIKIQTDGKLMTGRDVVIAALLGADEFGFATAPLISMGCVMMRVCHLNTCPVGIATQRKVLREKFKGAPEHVVNYFAYVAQEVRQLMAELGFKKLDDMIGRTDRLKINKTEHWKAKKIQLDKLIMPPEEGSKLHCTSAQDDVLDGALDYDLIKLCQDSLTAGKASSFEAKVNNTNRTVGTILGSEVSRRYGAVGLPVHTIKGHLHGTAGQSFAAFLPQGISLHLEGDANDYFGKGLCGGIISVRPPAGASFTPEKNSIIGNVCLYGATSGKAFINGMAGDRFCIRNSGALAVVEGIGDHGCEYMTGGVAVILGSTGRNFAAGMSGGIAYVLDTEGRFAEFCNQDSIALEKLEAEDEEALKSLLIEHIQYTQSPLASKIIDDWPSWASQFCKVMPNEYREALARIKAKEAAKLA